MKNEDVLKHADDVEKNWMLAKGKNELIKHLRGERLSSTDAIKAKCYECMGGYGDDKIDCGVTICPLHPIMPYNENKRAGRIVSEETKKKASDRFKEMWAKKKAGEEGKNGNGGAGDNE